MKEFLSEFLSLDTMITPKLITLFYFLGLLGCFFVSITVIGTVAYFSNFLSGLLAGILSFAFGVLSVRVACELSVVFFRMNEALQEIRKK